MRSRTLRAILFVFVICLCAVQAFGQSRIGFNRVTNFSFETVDSSNPSLASGWQVYGQPYTRVTNFNVWDGNYDLQVQANQGAVQHIVVNQDAAFPIRISARVKGNSIGNDPNDKLGASLDCKFADVYGRVYYCPTTTKTKMTGTFDWTWIGFNTADFDTAHIAWIDVRLHMGNVSGTAWFDDVHVDEWGPSGPGMVSFVFHDSFLSTYTKGAPLLRSYGYPYSLALVTGYLGADNIHMTLAEAQQLYAAGGVSILSHTVTHRDLTTLDTNTLNDELYFSQKFLVDNGLPTKHFAAPFGAYNGPVVSRIESEWYGNYPYLSLQTMDSADDVAGQFPYNVMARAVLSTTTMDDVKSWMQQAQYGGWLVLVIHEIDNANGVYTVPYTMLQQIVALVSQYHLQTVTYDNGFDFVTKQQY